MSWYVRYRSTDGRTLLGGVMQSETSRFQFRKQVEDRIEGIKDVHPGREVHFDILESSLPPEIFYHCDDAPATCVGARCSGCGKLLTGKDALSAARR
jgi:hypothetical protein